MAKEERSILGFLKLKPVEEKENYEAKKVNITANMFKKLKNFLKKLGEGITTVAHIPSTVFEIVKNHKKKSEKEKKEKKAKEEQKESEEETSTEEKAKPEARPGLTLSQLQQSLGEKGEKEITSTDETIESENSEEEKNAEEDSNEQNSAENEVIPVANSESIPPQDELEEEIIEPDTSKLDESINTYGDLTKFASWDDYYGSFTEKQRKEMSRKHTLLDELDFTAIRLKQAEEKREIAERNQKNAQIRKAKLEAEKNARVAQKDANKKEIEDLNKKIQQLASENEQINQANRNANTEIRKEDKIIASNTSEMENMDQIIDASKAPIQEEPTREEKIDAKTDEIMAKIMENVYGDESATAQNEEQTTEEPVAPQLPIVDEEKKEDKVAEGQNNETSVDIFAPAPVVEQGATIDSSTNRPETSEQVDLTSELDSVFDRSPLPEGFQEPQMSPAWKLDSVESQLNQDQVANLEDLKTLLGEADEIVGNEPKGKTK